MVKRKTSHNFGWGHNTSAISGDTSPPIIEAEQYLNEFRGTLPLNKSSNGDGGYGLPEFRSTHPPISPPKVMGHNTLHNAGEEIPQSVLRLKWRGGG